MRWLPGAGPRLCDWAASARAAEEGPAPLTEAEAEQDPSYIGSMTIDQLRLQSGTASWYFRLMCSGRCFHHIQGGPRFLALAPEVKAPLVRFVSVPFASEIDRRKLRDRSSRGGHTQPEALRLAVAASLT